MNDQELHALQLLQQLLRDLHEPAFIWQIAALLLGLILAAWATRAWNKAHPEAQSGRYKQVGGRLIFPLVGIITLGLAQLLLRPFSAVTLLKLAMPLLAAMALVRLMVYVLRQAFPGAQWLTTWEKLIASFIWGALALHITDLAPFVIDGLTQVSFTVGKVSLNLWMLLSGAVTVCFTLVLALWIAAVIEARLMGMETIDNNLRIVGVRISKALLTVLALMFSMSLIGIDMTAFSVFTGALGVGLGFGLQKIASNYVSGFIILLDRSIRIGNIVRVGADSGVVSQITTRYTVLKSAVGAEFIVPNESFIGNVVENQTLTDNALRLSTSVGVAYDSDVELAMRLMKDCALAQERVLTEPGPGVLLTAFADSSINLELGFWIRDPENGKGNIVSDINLAIWKTFAQHGVSIPFPQREVRLLTPSS